jgi:hypothetical protein
LKQSSALPEDQLILPQDNRSALVKTDSVKRILSNVYADHGDFG